MSAATPSPTPVSLQSFEGETPGIKIDTRSATAEPASEGVTDGQSALHLPFSPPAAYPAVFFNFDPPRDFRTYGGLAFDAFNPTQDTVKFGVRVDSDKEADGNGNHSRSGGGTLEPGEKVTFMIPFGADPSAYKMKSLPGYAGYRSLGKLGQGPFDLSHIVTWQIFTGRLSSPQTIIIDNVRLVPAQREDFTKLVDLYGQFTRADWPGKIRSGADFAAQIQAEDQDLAAHPRSADFDEYGGWAKGPQLPATGFFRTAKHEGKWAFVDPAGYLFLSLGLDTVGPSSSTALAGREAMFSVPPQDDPILAKYVAKDASSVDFMAANLERKYGPDFRAKWFARIYSRLPSWGFNTIGGFSSWEVFNNGKVPYSATVWPANRHARVAAGGEAWRKMDDPYDPQFAKDVAASVDPQAKRIKDDSYCLGYFVGNEESWGYFRGGVRSQYSLILGALKAPAADSPAKRAMLGRLKAQYGDVARLNAAWGTHFADWAALDAPVILKEPFPQPLVADFSTLLRDYAEQYFRTVRDVIRKADPNHLYLGCRFAGYSPEVLDAASKYADVLSFNLYRTFIDPKEFTVLDPYDKPLLIGEFYFCASDRGHFDPSLVSAADQDARGRAYQRYIRSVLTNPKFVGAHWFQILDQPPIGRNMPDGENSNCGFLAITDTPYPELIAAAREINRDAYKIRFGKSSSPAVTESHGSSSP